MVVNLIFDIVTGTKEGNDGDFNDRLNHRYSSLVLAFCAIFAMSTQLIGQFFVFRKEQKTLKISKHLFTFANVKIRILYDMHFQNWRQISVLTNHHFL